jgi:hypothetical protein
VHPLFPPRMGRGGRRASLSDYQRGRLPAQHELRLKLARFTNNLEELANGKSKGERLPTRAFRLFD